MSWRRRRLTLKMTLLLITGAIRIGEPTPKKKMRKTKRKKRPLALARKKQKQKPQNPTPKWKKKAAALKKPWSKIRRNSKKKKDPSRYKKLQLSGSRTLLIMKRRQIRFSPELTSTMK